MYHPGKVIGIFRSKEKDVKSSDESTQALIEMWDENIFTLSVDPKIATALKEKDTVLVDYSPFSEKMPVAKQIICKIIYKKKAKLIWDEYRDYARQKKKQVATKTPIRNYMG
ncbi:MAG: hypothetical protein KKA65_04140 [Nanoarchaeota archaeon]|nr:hypothetical protein [Nanoarchaeota archaeon]MBU4241693.1 hypothetical protein [Nanoarchaeota archaeon]MBU4351778.1 hypothetical protein [Nanoarchaeota archaeon]MBU4456668.1 hypothetical protein [Nanoarchaeota archaeon]MCG2719450.1 hypothetical protein [Nanoarchaeota archaeon]